MRTPERAAVLTGLGAWTPPDVLSNEQLSAKLGISDEWIRKRIGVVRRHVASPGMATSNLAVEAGQRALKSAGVDAVDAVVLATTTPDHPCPATAPAVSDCLGLGSVPAFDIAAVCAGFVYALASGAGLIAVGIAERVLVIGADMFTTLVDPGDPINLAIFGDGAGAAVLVAGSPDDLGAIGPFHLGSDGRGANLITVPAGGSRLPARGLDGGEGQRYFVMQGQPVYRQAVATMVASTQRALDMAGWPVHTLDWLVCHQANKRILEAVTARLAIPADRCVVNIDQVGNTAAASIPLALVHGAESGAFRPGDRIALTGFGGGLSWGSTLLRWPDIDCNG